MPVMQNIILIFDFCHQRLYRTSTFGQDDAVKRQTMTPS
jgi:hypothetical protein